jgi:homogentisate 1,2-dioxygenase
MPRVYGSPFAIDYNNLDQVIAYAERLGGSSIVTAKYKNGRLLGYGIRHAENHDRFTERDGRDGIETVIVWPRRSAD